MTLIKQLLISARCDLLPARLPRINNHGVRWLCVQLPACHSLDVRKPIKLFHKAIRLTSHPLRQGDWSACTDSLHLFHGRAAPEPWDGPQHADLVTTEHTVLVSRELHTAFPPNGFISLPLNLLKKKKTCNVFTGYPPNYCIYFWLYFYFSFSNTAASGA